MLEIGNNAPLFSVLDQSKNSISLESFRGKYVVLYFYPKDNTPGCTLEANDFSRLFSDFQSEEAVILGVSKDSVESHDKFCKKYNLPFSLLSDVDQTITDEYKAWGEKKNFGLTYMGLIRTTYLIDREGKIAYVWPKVKTKGHAESVLTHLKIVTKKGI